MINICGPMNVNFPPEIRQQLEEFIPPRQRLKFITQAVEQALKAVAKQRALAALEAIKPVSVEKDSVEIIREIRQKR